MFSSLVPNVINTPANRVLMLWHCAGVHRLSVVIRMIKVVFDHTDPLCSYAYFRPDSQQDQ